MKQVYDLLIFTMSHWKTWQQYVGKTRRSWFLQPTGVVNRNYHVLNQLLNSPQINQVLIVDLIPFTTKRSLRVLAESIIGHVPGQNVTRKFYVNGLVSKVTQIAPHRFVYSTARNLTKTEESEAIWTEISSILKITGFRNLLLWSYFPMFARPFAETAALKIFDAVDDWREHPYCQQWRSLLDKHYRTIDRQANVIFTVSPQARKIFPTNRHVHWMPNGIDYDHFQHPGRTLAARLAKIPKPVIGYLGIIESRLDFSLLEKIAQQFPRASLLLAGPVWKEANIGQLKAIPNVHWFGPVAYADLPELYHYFDVAIIPHRVTAFTKSMNPLKMYEYLACGLPVVTTPVAGTEQFPSLITVADNVEDFLKALKFHLEHHLSSADKEKCRRAVRLHTWTNRIAEMFKHIADPKHHD
jgi:glycosyltransferase involved in cell wall biosynthesis